MCIVAGFGRRRRGGGNKSGIGGHAGIVWGRRRRRLRSRQGLVLGAHPFRTEVHGGSRHFDRLQRYELYVLLGDARCVEIPKKCGFSASASSSTHVENIWTVRTLTLGSVLHCNVFILYYALNKLLRNYNQVINPFLPAKRMLEVLQIG